MKLTVDKALSLTSLFLRWWATQLRACANDLTSAMVPGRRRVLSIYWDAARLVIADENTAQPRVLMEVPSNVLAEAAPADLKPILESSSRARLFVSGTRVFLRQVQVPLAVVPHLDSAIALQLPKLLPLAPADLMVDFAVTATDTNRNLANIDLAALRKVEIGQLLERLSAWGLHIVSTHLGDPSAATQRFSFSNTGALHHGPELKKPDRLLVAIAGTLGLACASVAATESYRSHATLQNAMEITRVPAAAALGHRQELLARLEPLRALAELEAVPSTSALLADLTMLVPQNTYLTTLEVHHGAVRIVGVSPNSGSVVKLLSSSKLLNDVALRSSMSVGIGTGLDRFEVTAELKGTP